jgi:hypothetical protein
METARYLIYDYVHVCLVALFDPFCNKIGDDYLLRTDYGGCLQDQEEHAQPLDYEGPRTGVAWSHVIQHHVYGSREDLGMLPKR